MVNPLPHLIKPPSDRMCNALWKLASMTRILHQSVEFLNEWFSICHSYGLPELKLITAASTRWNSRYEQIDRARTYRLVYLDMVTGHDKYAKYALSDSEWALLEWLWALLHHLNVCSKYVGVTKLPSIGFMIPCFGKMIDLFENEPEPYLETQEERQLW